MGSYDSLHPREVVYPVTFPGCPIQVRAFLDYNHFCIPILDRDLGSQFMLNRLDPNRADIDLLPILLHSNQEDSLSPYHAHGVQLPTSSDMGLCFDHHLPTSPSTFI